MPIVSRIGKKAVGDVDTGNYLALGHNFTIPYCYYQLARGSRCVQNFRVVIAAVATRVAYSFKARHSKVAAPKRSGQTDNAFVSKLCLCSPSQSLAALFDKADAQFLGWGQ